MSLHLIFCGEAADVGGPEEAVGRSQEDLSVIPNWITAYFLLDLG